MNIEMNKQRGFSLVEIFIALAVGLALFAGVLSVFVGMRTTTTETSGYGELQENGRFAISVLTEDLFRQDFWGDYTGTFERGSLLAGPVAPVGADCQGGGINNATFPAVSGQFRTLWGITALNATPMSCITDAKVGSDVIQLKRVVANPIAVVPPAAAPANNYYLVTNTNGGAVVLGGVALPVIDNARVWQYQHHIYYIKEEKQGSNVVPVLMQGRLTTEMSFDPFIDGIEMIRFMYGVDTDDDGVVNAFISATNMTNTFWDSGANSKIIAVKIYVLARNISPDVKYKNTNTYWLGDLKVVANDNYRRLLFSSTVTLFNARVDKW